ncbi:unnamed protein product [Dovyalis caffra]|uniref:Uncharacterized protein n=1 Tax=Dovyalis caffra TaxID=77055 RepID=A0AAV1QW17_9ROSI|nr:unnamed protein product [Dovyalis caffra]
MSFECNCRYVGFYKGVQSAGAAVAWQVDSHEVPLLNQLIVNWSLTTVSYPLLAILVMLAVKDDKQDEEASVNPASMDNNSKPVYKSWQFKTNEIFSNFEQMKIQVSQSKKNFRASL